MRLLAQSRRRLAVLAVCVLVSAGLAAASGAPAAVSALPTPVPTVSDFQFLAASQTPPSEANCFSVGRRCFTPTSMQNSYNLGPLYAAGHSGQGVTIAIIDSFGNPNMASDLQVFNNQMGLPHMCGEPGASCASGTPTFQHVFWNGKTMVKAPPPNSKGVGLQTRNIWALEVVWTSSGARDRAPGQHPQRDHQPGRDARRAGLRR